MIRLVSGALEVATIASIQAEGYWRDYRKSFTELEVQKLVYLHLDSRE